MTDEPRHCPSWWIEASPLRWERRGPRGGSLECFWSRKGRGVVWASDRTIEPQAIIRFLDMLRSRGFHLCDECGRAYRTDPIEGPHRCPQSLDEVRPDRRGYAVGSIEDPRRARKERK